MIYGSAVVHPHGFWAKKDSDIKLFEKYFWSVFDVIRIRTIVGLVIKHIHMIWNSLKVSTNLPSDLTVRLLIKLSLFCLFYDRQNEIVNV